MNMENLNISSIMLQHTPQYLIHIVCTCQKRNKYEGLTYKTAFDIIIKRKNQVYDMPSYVYN